MLSLLLMFCLQARADLEYINKVEVANTYLTAQLKTAKDAHNLNVRFAKLQKAEHARSEILVLEVPENISDYTLTATYNELRIFNHEILQTVYIFNSEKSITRNNTVFEQGPNEARTQFFKRIIAPAKAKTSLVSKLISFAYAGVYARGRENDYEDFLLVQHNNVMLSMQVLFRESDGKGLFPSLPKWLPTVDPKNVKCETTRALGRITLADGDANFAVTPAKAELQVGKDKFIVKPSRHEPTKEQLENCDTFSRLTTAQRDLLSNHRAVETSAFRSLVNKNPAVRKLSVAMNRISSQFFADICNHPRIESVALLKCKDDKCDGVQEANVAELNSEFRSAQVRVRNSIGRLPLGKDMVIVDAPSPSVQFTTSMTATLENADGKKLLEAKKSLTQANDLYSASLRVGELTSDSDRRRLAALFDVQSCCADTSCRAKVMEVSKVNMIPAKPPAPATAVK